MTLCSSKKNDDLKSRENREARTESPAKTAWRKPVLKETNCALEINCYVTASVSQPRR